METFNRLIGILVLAWIAWLLFFRKHEFDNKSTNDQRSSKSSKSSKRSKSSKDARLKLTPNSVVSRPEQKHKPYIVSHPKQSQEPYSAPNDQKESYPDFSKFPKVDTQKKRENTVIARSNVEWREEGILSLSGYRVGRTKGVPPFQREKILNNLMLFDDLSDVEDRSYAREWGNPQSKQRYKKICNSINTFIANAQGRGSIMRYAINDWERDLGYLNKIFGNWFG